MHVVGPKGSSRGLFVVRGPERAEPCQCSCHPRPPTSDFHDYGDACPCQQTAEERRRHWEEWEKKNDRYSASPEGRAITARRQAEEDELAAWIASDPGVVVTSYGGMAPEQWRGSVDGHSFYFRERHGSWRIDVDLRPTGLLTRVWKGRDLDSDDSFEYRDTEEGDIIAEGVEGAPGYGERPVEQAQFIVGTVRDYLDRQACTFHPERVEEAGRALGLPIVWCPGCGTRLGGGHPTA